MRWGGLLTWVSALGAGALLLAAFLHTVQLRSGVGDRYPGPGDGLWRMNSALASQAAREWYEEGILASGLAPRLQWRNTSDPGIVAPFLSYPPMFVLVPTVLARLAGVPPAYPFVKRIGSGAQLVLGGMCGLFVVFALLAFGAAPALALAFGGLAGAACIVMPPAVLFMPFSWWADTSVLPVYGAMLAAEAWQSWRGRSPELRALQAALAALGVLSDWLFFLLLGALLLKDLTARPRRFRWELALLPALYVARHIRLVITEGRLSHFQNKILERTGLAEGSPGFFDGLSAWFSGAFGILGPAGGFLYLASLVSLPLLAALFFFRHRLHPRLRAWAELTFCASLPVHLHVLFTWQHYVGHIYGATKLAFLLPALWLGLVPGLLATSRAARKRSWSPALLLLLTAGGAVAFYGSFAHIPGVAMANAQSLEPALERRCLDLASLSAAIDLSFSPDFANVDELASTRRIPAGKPVDSWARFPCVRVVHLAMSPGEVASLYRLRLHRRIVTGLAYRLRLWTAGPPARHWEPYLEPGSRVRVGELEAHDLKKDVLFAEP